MRVHSNLAGLQPINAQPSDSAHSSPTGKSNSFALPYLEAYGYVGRGSLSQQASLPIIPSSDVQRKRRPSSSVVHGRQHSPQHRPESSLMLPHGDIERKKRPSSSVVHARQSSPQHRPQSGVPLRTERRAAGIEEQELHKREKGNRRTGSKVSSTHDKERRPHTDGYSQRRKSAPEVLSMEFKDVISRIERHKLTKMTKTWPSSRRASAPEVRSTTTSDWTQWKENVGQPIGKTSLSNIGLRTLSSEVKHWEDRPLSASTGTLRPSMMAAGQDCFGYEAKASFPQAQRRLSESFCEPVKLQHIDTQSTMCSLAELYAEGHDRDSFSRQTSADFLPFAAQQHEFLPTVEDALSRYSDDGFRDTERQRMRLAYIRYAEADTHEVHAANLQEILVHLGYFTAGDKGNTFVQTISKFVTSFSTLDFEEFQEFVMRFAVGERAELRAKAASFAQSGSQDLNGIQKFLESLGVITCDKVLTEAMHLANVSFSDGLEDIGERELLRILSALRATEGFTAEEIAEAKGIFDGLEQLPSCRRSAMTGCPVKASELTNGLLEFEGPYYVPYLTQLATSPGVPTSDDAPGLSFYEFLVWARRLRGIGMQSLASAFAGAKEAGHGIVSVDLMLKSVVGLGFTLLDNAAGELLCQNDFLRDQESVDLSMFVRFMDACRSTHGFTATEIRDFLDVYARFDADGKGELEGIEVLSMLRYQGHTTKLIDAENLIKQVDFNGNGTMDRHEFLRLMRLQREQVIANARSAFDKARGSRDALPADELVKAFDLYGIELRMELLDDLRREHGHGATLPFDTFVGIVDRGQEIAALERRKRANLPTDNFNALESNFRLYAVAKTGMIQMSQLLEILSEANVPVETWEQQSAMFNMLEAARTAALDAGCAAGSEVSDDVGRNRCVYFLEFVHLVRSLLRQVEETAAAREKEAVEDTKFTLVEVAEFRKVFAKTVHDNEQQPPGGGAAAGLGRVLRDLFNDSAKPLNSHVLLESLARLTTSIREREDLEDKVNDLTKDTVDIDFASYLWLMRWMLDKNFARINGANK